MERQTKLTSAQEMTIRLGVRSQCKEYETLATGDPNAALWQQRIQECNTLLNMLYRCKAIVLEEGA